MKKKYLFLSTAVAVVALAWDLVDEKSFTANWWMILPITLGVGLYDAMLKSKTEVE